MTISGIGLREATLAFYLSPGVTLGQVISFSVAFLLVVSGSAALFGALAYMFWRVDVPVAPAVGLDSRPEGAPRA